MAKQWLEHDNPNAVGMTGLIGYGGAYGAIHDAELLLLLGTDFPFSEFLPGSGVKKVQIDRNPKHLGRRTPVDLALVGIPGAMEQKTRLRNQESSSIASEELRRGRSCPRWTASGTEKA